MKRLILGVAAALMLSAGPAAADGMPSKGSIKAAPVAAGPSWNGFYVGAGIGAGAVVHDLSLSVRDEHDYPTIAREFGMGGDSFSAGLDGLGGEGIFGTITIGYDRVIRPGWVAGVFADYDFGSNISTDVTFGGGSASLIEHNHSWAVGARLGMLANPGTLLYATAGYTQADFDFLEGLLSQTFDGYFVGAGVETFLHSNWTLKLEYRFTQFNSEDLLSGLGVPASLDVEPSMHAARLVLSYKFGHRD